MMSPSATDLLERAKQRAAEYNIPFSEALAQLYTMDLELANDEVDEDEEYDDEPSDGFRDDVEADADTLASAGYGTDEDYGCFGGEEW